VGCGDRGAELKTLKGHYSSVSSVVFSQNNKFLLSGSYDTTVKVWDIDSGQEVASLISFGERDWVIITPNGLFDGSPAAWSKIAW
jgi:WD40 repeat protein